MGFDVLSFEGPFYNSDFKCAAYLMKKVSMGSVFFHKYLYIIRNLNQAFKPYVAFTTNQSETLIAHAYSICTYALTIITFVLFIADSHVLSQAVSFHLFFKSFKFSFACVLLLFWHTAST